jgi:hypothetical protein
MGLRGQEKNAEYLKNIYSPHFLPLYIGEGDGAH